MSTRRPGPAAAVVAAVVLALGALLPAPAIGAEPPQWNIERIGAPVSAAGALIAVVDTGVDPGHPVFTGRVRKAIDLVGGNGGDPNGHGTHVAGVAAGADNGCGTIGVAPDAAILPVRVLDEDGAGLASDVAKGIRMAADAGATVINLSLGTDVALRNVAGSGLEEAIREAWSKGAIPVLAAGNDGVVGSLFGSGYGDLPAVVVTATDHQDRVAPYATSIGSAAWGIAAPGGDGSEQQGRDILSSYKGSQCALSAGTSMAAPHVSGALAVLRARGLGPRQAVERLLSTARDLGTAGRDGTYGHGLVDLRAAIGTAPPATVTTAATTPAAPATTAATGDPAPTTTVARRPATGDSPGAAAPTTVPGAPTAADPLATGAADDDGRSDASAAPPADTEESGGPLVVRDRGEEDDDGVPIGVVAVAVGALAASGIGAGAMARRLGRRPGLP